MGILTDSRNTPTVLDLCFNRCYYQMQAYLQIRAVNVAVTVAFSVLSLAVKREDRDRRVTGRLSLFVLLVMLDL